MTTEEPTTFLVTDDDGAPAYFLDVPALLDDAEALGYRLAAAAGTPDVDRLLAESLDKHGPQAFGKVTTAALRHVIDSIVGPLLDVTDELHARGLLDLDGRALLAAAGEEVGA